MNAVPTPSQSIQATKSYFHFFSAMFNQIQNYCDPFQLSALYREYLELQPHETDGKQKLIAIQQRRNTKSDILFKAR